MNTLPVDVALLILLNYGLSCQDWVSLECTCKSFRDLFLSSFYRRLARALWSARYPQQEAESGLVCFGCGGEMFSSTKDHVDRHRNREGYPISRRYHDKFVGMQLPKTWNSGKLEFVRGFLFMGSKKRLTVSLAFEVGMERKER
jgi:hypothetical protein